MARKPTQPFGHIVFSKDGSVEKRMSLLPDDKEGQEGNIVERFVDCLSRCDRHFEPVRLAERDNDFLLTSTDGGTDVLLEMVELAWREYLVEATEEDLKNPNSRFSSWVYISKNEIYGVDEDAKEKSLTRLITHKIDRNYEKPSDKEFWLLVWTVLSDHHFEWHQNGEKHVSTSILVAREHIAAHGAEPFDQVWAFYPELNPCRIWPEVTE